MTFSPYKAQDNHVYQEQNFGADMKKHYHPCIESIVKALNKNDEGCNMEGNHHTFSAMDNEFKWVCKVGSIKESSFTDVKYEYEMLYETNCEQALSTAITEGKRFKCQDKHDGESDGVDCDWGKDEDSRRGLYLAKLNGDHHHEFWDLIAVDSEDKFIKFFKNIKESHHYAECFEHFSKKDEYQCAHGHFKDEDGKIECKDIAIPKECHDFIKSVVTEDNPNYEHYLVTLIKKKEHEHLEFLINHKHHHHDHPHLIFETVIHKDLKITEEPKEEVHHNEHHKKNCFHHFTEHEDGKYKCPHDKFEDKGDKIECNDIEIPEACKEFVHSVVKSEHYHHYSISLVGSNKDKKFELMIKHGKDEKHKEDINGLKGIIRDHHHDHRHKCFKHFGAHSGEYNCPEDDFVDEDDKNECRHIAIPDVCEDFVKSEVPHHKVEDLSISLIEHEDHFLFQIRRKDDKDHHHKELFQHRIDEVKKIHHVHVEPEDEPKPEEQEHGKKECFDDLSKNGAYNCHHPHKLEDGKKVCRDIHRETCKKFVESKEECEEHQIKDCSITLIEEGDGHCMFKIMKKGEERIFEERIPEKLKIVHKPKEERQERPEEVTDPEGTDPEGAEPESAEAGLVLDGSEARRPRGESAAQEPEKPKEEPTPKQYRHEPQEPEDEPTPKAEHDNPPNVITYRKNNAQGSDSRSISFLYVLITFFLIFPMNLFVRFR